MRILINYFSDEFKWFFGKFYYLDRCRKIEHKLYEYKESEHIYKIKKNEIISNCCKRFMDCGIN